MLLWWVTQTTQSTSALALAAIVALLPHALLTPLGGTLADRLNRRGILVSPSSLLEIR